MAARPPEDLRKAVRALVQWSDGPGTTHHIAQSRQKIPGGTVETLMLEGHPPVPATLLLPDGPGPHPTIVYCHGHGGDYSIGRRELMDGAPWLTEAFGPHLLRAGFAVLAIDAICFGDRQDEWTENASAKSLFWLGSSLFAAMLDELRDAVGYLVDHDGIDETRIFTFGVSMGAAHAWWLAALDDRVAGAAHACMLADIEGLLENSAHDRHGLYYVVPGLRQLCDQGHVASLVAPRPQFIAHGATDTLAPERARRSALGRVTHAYRDHPDQLTTFLEPEAGHHFTKTMQSAALTFLKRHAFNEGQHA